MKIHILLCVLLLVFALFFVVINLTIIPVIFWFVFMPKLEKELGKKLEFDSMYKMIPLGIFVGGYFDTIIYITDKYVMLKIFGNQNIFKSSEKRALQKINYNVENAPTSLVIISFIGIITMALSLLFLIIVFAISRIYPA